jgi:hypothetical protein
MGKVLVRSAVDLLVLGILAALSACSVQAQQAPINCSGPLNEAGLIGLLKGGVEDARVQAIVNKCGVDFAFNADVERSLRAAKASDALIVLVRTRAPKPTPKPAAPKSIPELTTIELARLSRMSLEEARQEAAMMQGKVDQIRETVGAERDQAMQQVEEKYRLEGRKMAKGPFESSAEYEKRRADLESRYMAERKGVEKRYTGELEEKARSYTSQISYLSKRTYLIEGSSPEFVSYDADTSRLTANISGEEYWFRIEREAARSLVGRWRTVKVEQYLGEERSQERVLMDPATGARFDGILRSVEEERIRREIELTQQGRGLVSAKRDLEGTQRQLIDVKETLTVAVAKNSSELDALRRKGERNYYEFSIPKKGQLTKVGDIQVILKNTDAKKGTFTIDILVDDNKIEKKDRNVNEPLQFLVGSNRLRYELVISWVEQYGRVAGGYLSVPK